MKLLITMTSIAAFVCATNASAQGKESAVRLAECAWNKVPDTALVLSKIKAKKRKIYDGVDQEKSAPPFMRVYAACESEWRALVTAVNKDEVGYYLLKNLKKTEPKTLSADTFTTRVFRCEAHFPDKETSSSAAKVWWGYGQKITENTLTSRQRLFNSQVKISISDIGAIEKRGDGADNLVALLAKTKKQEVLEVETYQAGLLTKKAFRIKATLENSKCQTISPEGVLIDA